MSENRCIKAIVQTAAFRNILRAVPQTAPQIGSHLGLLVAQAGQILLELGVIFSALDANCALGHSGQHFLRWVMGEQTHTARRQKTTKTHMHDKLVTLFYTLRQYSNRVVFS